MNSESISKSENLNTNYKKSTMNTRTAKWMGRLSALFLMIAVVSSCQQEKAPETAAEMKALIKEKKAAIKEIEMAIAELDKKIEVLEPKKEKGPALISTQLLEAINFKRYTEVQASVISDEKVFVTSETGGRLLSVNAQEGQYVKRGQLLATVDLQSLKDQRSELETGMSLAKDVYDRQKRLWDQNIGSEIQYLQAKNNYERLQKTLATLNTQINKSSIYAPISGVVDMEFLKPGELAGPGAPILQLFNPNKLKVTADIPETYLGKIKRGDKVDINLLAIDKQMTKSVTLLGRTIDPSNRTFKVEVATNSANGAIKPNLLAELSFNDYAKKDAIVVPLEIVQQEVSGKKYVFAAVDKGGKMIAEKVYVTTGEGYEGIIIIEDGLTAGDQIIINGARSVANGDLVKVINN